jgi:amino acid transporter
MDSSHDAGAAVAVKRALIGRPRATVELGQTLLSKKLALPVFASDPLSSVAYATEAALVVLLAASASSAHLVLPISAVIAALLAIVVLSYTQTVKAYETSGGAYVVSRENLGTLPSLVAAAALLVDYVLTVAVSVAAGVLALTSAAPSLEGHAVELSLGFILLLTVVNLRGVREAGILFALPTYSFVAAIYVMIGAGLVRSLLGESVHATVPNPVATGAGAVGVLVLLRAFASGASALTGVEAISNGVSAFRPPQSANAAKTLLAMGAIAITLFLGVSYLAVKTGARPSGSVSVISEIARAIFPDGSPFGAFYYVVQAVTFAILVLAANTSYQGFPRLSAVLATDRFFPRQFVNLGDRLVYSNGIIVLAAAAAGLIWFFHAEVNSLIHLYVIGVFTAFTLSQAGMVRYWLRRREPGFRRRIAINGLGAAATGVVTLLVIEAKFAEGAWMVTVAVPVLIGLFLLVHRHYRIVGRRLAAGAAAVRAAGEPTNEVVVHVDGLDEASRLAAWYARQIAGTSYHPIYVPDGRGTDPRGRWWDFVGGGAPIETLPTAETPVESVLDYVWSLPRGESTFVTVIIPEHFRSRSLVTAVVGKRTTFVLKLRLLSETGIVVTDVPVLAGESDVLPSRAVARVLVSGVHAASLRAVNYAGALGLEDTSAVYVAFDRDEARRMEHDWHREGVAIPLEIVDAPYRDLGEALLRHLRELTSDPNTVASVVMPEVIIPGVRKVLHNQRALYVKRLLLFEPRVILSSVPYHLP